MRQINFVIIFAMCLALVLFGLQNTAPVSIQFVEGVEVQTPLAVALVLAMGIGAVLAWLFSIWTRFAQWLMSFGTSRKLRSQDKHIQQLEDDVKQYQAELDAKQLPALSAAKSAPEEAQSEEAVVEQS